MTKATAVIFYFLLLILIQRFLLVFIMKRINKEFKSMKKRGDLIVGSHKGRFGVKTYAAICIKDEKIISLRVMKRSSILSKFKDYDYITSGYYQEMLAMVERSVHKNSFESAIEYALRQYAQKQLVQECV